MLPQGPLAQAIRNIEATSSVEVVVEVRTRSGAYDDAASRFGALAGFVMLLVVLFSRWEFAALWVPLGVAVSYVAGYVIARYSPWVQRLMTSRGERERKVRVAAAASFFERGIANTQRSTGLLVYLSLMERRFELIADEGILNAVPVIEWNQMLELTRKPSTTADLLPLLTALESMLTRCLPKTADDRDELSNEVRVEKE